MRHRVLVGAISALIMLATIPLYSVVKQEYIPTDVDEGEFEIRVTAPEGTSMESMDAALRQISNTLSRTFLRRVDFVSRYGGDEFAIILQETGLDNAFMLAERLRRVVSELPPIEVPGGAEPPKLTLTIGIGELKLGDTGMDWVKRADAALYHAKRAGRDRVHTIAG